MEANKKLTMPSTSLILLQAAPYYRIWNFLRRLQGRVCVNWMLRRLHSYI